GGGVGEARGGARLLAGAGQHRLDQAEGELNAARRSWINSVAGWTPATVLASLPSPPQPHGRVMARFEDLPYRPCVGTMVLNAAGRVLIRRRPSGPEHVAMVTTWPRPQSGPHQGESPWPPPRR